jgi:hypothetical protein
MRAAAGIALERRDRLPHKALDAPGDLDRPRPVIIHGSDSD